MHYAVLKVWTYAHAARFAYHSLVPSESRRTAPPPFLQAPLIYPFVQKPLLGNSCAVKRRIFVWTATNHTLSEMTNMMRTPPFIITVFLIYAFPQVRLTCLRGAALLHSQLLGLTQP